MMRKRIGDNLMSLVGKTPLIFLNEMAKGHPGRVAAKMECFNPTGSVKDRIVLGMIRDAEKRGYLEAGSIIIEPTSGNTGIGLACFCAIKGYKLILTMPETMSLERRKILTAYGAELIITPGDRGMRGAIEKAEELMEETDGAFMLQQFNNTSNPEAHEKTTGVEIWDDTGGEVDIFVAGVGTGGTLTGVARCLKKKKEAVRIVAVEPEKSAILSGGKPGVHRIQGIGAGFIPRIMDVACIDEIIGVSDEAAIETCRRLAAEEGILAGVSSGAAAWAALQLSQKKENEGKLIVVILPDSGEKYLSAGLFE